jgi:3-oxoacyl-ACP reductase-like protein
LIKIFWADREREIGFSTATSFAIRGEALKVGFETSYRNISRAGAGTKAQNIFELGPAFTIKPSPHTRIDLAPLCGITHDSPYFDLFVIYSIDFGTSAAANGNTPMAQSPNSAKLRLENQVAVITGGARGIGAGIVRRFIEEGARVVFSDLLNEKGKALEEELGKNAAFYRADATSPSDTETLMKFAVEHFGRLDCVSNSAGATAERGIPIAETSVEGFDR